MIVLACRCVVDQPHQDRGNGEQIRDTMLLDQLPALLFVEALTTRDHGLCASDRVARCSGAGTVCQRRNHQRGVFVAEAGHHVRDSTGQNERQLAVGHDRALGMPGRARGIVLPYGVAIQYIDFASRGPSMGGSEFIIVQTAATLALPSGGAGTHRNQVLQLR